MFFCCVIVMVSMKISYLQESKNNVWFIFQGIIPFLLDNTNLSETASNEIFSVFIGIFMYKEAFTWIFLSLVVRVKTVKKEI